MNETCTICHGDRGYDACEPSLGGVGGYQLIWHACTHCRGTGLEPCERCGDTGLVDGALCECCMEPEVEPVIVGNQTIDAPGFTTETFLAGVIKAQERGELAMRPVGGGTIEVDSGKPGSVYRVTRHSCTCRGSEFHGHCYHRAAVIFVNDVCGIDVCHTALLGFGADGEPVVAVGMAVAS